MSEADGTVPWRELLAEAIARLERAGVENAAHDARRIVEEASGFEGATLSVSLGELVTERGIARFDAMLARREGGEPLQYVLGRWGFRTLDLAVDARVLIPRPETESLVEVALTHIDRVGSERSPVVVADLGTGSGAIALSIAVERPNTIVLAVDSSADAVAAARANLVGIGRAGARVTIAEGDWFGAFDTTLLGQLDVIVSNPPYVLSTDELPASVLDWEPHGALFSGADGLDDIRGIVSNAPRWLRPGGALALELDPRQAHDVVGLMIDAGFVDVEILRDLPGRDRFVAGRHPN